MIRLGLFETIQIWIKMELNLEPLRLFIDLNIVVSPKNNYHEKSNLDQKWSFWAKIEGEWSKGATFKSIQNHSDLRNHSVITSGSKHRFVYEYT